MANYRAISAVSHGVVSLLQGSYDEATENELGTELVVSTFTASGFQASSAPSNPAISLFLYRVVVNGNYRIPAGQIAPDGTRSPARLPLDLHFILTAWANEPSMQYDIAGWMMRVIEDTPILPGPFLNQNVPDTFGVSESVELVVDELESEDLFLLWERLGPNAAYQLSIPYVARNVWIDSMLTAGEGKQVLQRRFNLAVPNGEST